MYVKSGAAFKMKGSSCVTPLDDDNDVYLDGGSKIELDGPLTPEGGKAARITVPDSQYQISTQVLDGSITDGTPQNYTKFTVTPKDTTPWYVGSNGRLTTVKP